MSEASPWITETSEATFQQDVIDRSVGVPVVVDFWAAWCQPCRTLAPLLERLAVEFDGRFVLVKANVDELPSVATALGVQAIPAVFAVREGQIVDQFVGVLSEPQLRQWLDGIVPGPAHAVAAEAQLLEASDPQAAEGKYREAIEMMPSEIWVRVGLARTLMTQGRLDEAGHLLDELAETGVLDAEGERLQAELTLARQAQEAGGLDQVRAAAEAAPNDLATQLRLARALAADGQYQPAMDVCLKVLEKDRAGQGEPARELMVQIFHLLGPESDLVAEYRRRLTMALY